MALLVSRMLPLSLLLVASVLLFLLRAAQGQGVSLHQKKDKVPALIVFGDSIVDSGNNNGLKTIVKCNFPPYGRDFPQQQPTGRFSNGRIPSDMIASALGVKDLVPAYLDPYLTPEDLLTGVSFASGAAGYDPLTSQLMSVLTLDDELKLFREYQTKLKTIAGEKRASSIINDSIYLVIIGTDDFANSYFSTPFRKKQFDIPSYTDFLVQKASKFYQGLYELGARKMIIVGLPPIGCVPSQRTLSGGIERQCQDVYNEAAQLTNSKLSKVVSNLPATLPGSRMVYADIYNILLELVLYPSKYGFKVSEKGCCGTGTVEVSVLCNELDPTTCTDVSDYVFWDSYHPTQKAYEIIAGTVIRDYIPRLL
ncbi:GDSL esterase/lipase EXL3-like [Aristolochia californica]|uniref:GDSL esterase/lipase EXL3-like n=1 Tax=Aristolochia californica TaxID=171875 RepID=UPI0035D886AC